MSILPLAVGAATLLLTGRALILGSASASGDSITREEEPIFYWFCILAGVIAAVFLFYVGVRDRGS